MPEVQTHRNALTLFINGRKKEESQEVMNLLDEKDIRYFVHDFGGIKFPSESELLQFSQLQSPKLVHGALQFDAIGSSEIKKVVQKY